MAAEMKLAQALSMPVHGICRESPWAGDAGAFEELLASHQKRVFTLALRLLGDADEAASATQDCFLRAFRAATRCPEDTAGQQQWLCRLVINLCLDRAKATTMMMVRMRQVVSHQQWRKMAELQRRLPAPPPPSPLAAPAPPGGPPAFTPKPGRAPAPAPPPSPPEI